MGWRGQSRSLAVTGTHPPGIPGLSLEKEKVDTEGALSCMVASGVLDLSLLDSGHCVGHWEMTFCLSPASSFLPSLSFSAPFHGLRFFPLHSAGSGVTL